MKKKFFNGLQLFEGRSLVIATMHHKEKVMAPILEKELQVSCSLVSGLNTDIFGTFSGEIERKKSPLETVRSKALAALDKSSETLVVASEGSFGPHPSSMFLPANEEIVILIDIKHNIEIIGKHFTLDTNFRNSSISSLNELETFLEEIGYPEQGVVIKFSESNTKSKILKGFSSYEEIKRKVARALLNKTEVIAETDMRAMMNPTRMKAIEHATLNLIKNIKSLCPRCNAPGFVVKEYIPGLPCEMCHLPTKKPKAYIFHCDKCEFELKRLEEKVHYEEAMFCDFCNP